MESIAITTAEVDKQTATVKSNINVVFAGAVDHGKSSTIGSILVNLNLIEKKELERVKKMAEKNGRESWYLAYLMDSDQAEMLKGKTHDIAIKQVELKHRYVTIIDTPGHGNLISNMLQGLQLADVMILVVSARSDEFERGFHSGSLKQHILLAFTSNIQAVIVAVNKMDSCEWDQERYKFIQTQLFKFMREVGFQTNQIGFVPISSTHGINIVEPKHDFGQKLSLVQMMNRLVVPKRSTKAEDTFALVFDVPFQQKTNDQELEMACTTYGAKLHSGTIKQGDRLLAFPDEQVVEIQKIFTLKDYQEEEAVKAGDLVYFKTQTPIRQGSVLTYISEERKLHDQQEQTVYSSKVVKCELQILELDKMIITQGLACSANLNTLVKPVSIKHMFDLESQKKIQIARQHETIGVHLEFIDPIAIAKFSENALLGRFTLRIKDQTIAIAKVTGIKPLAGVADRLHKLQ